MPESLAFGVIAFVVAALVVAAASPPLARTADRLADKTGLGEALFGGVFLAAITSLPDLAASTKAAIDARPVLAVSTIMGSMAANLAFLGIGDLLYRKANLEHAAASAGNLVQAALLLTLISIALLAVTAPEVDLWGIHPATPLLVGTYIFGYSLIREAETKPMWRPFAGIVLSGAAKPDLQRRYSLVGLWSTLAVLALLTAGGGWLLMDSAQTIASETGLSETTVGTLFTALATSSPELLITIAAIRQGALVLAVGGIIGTNCFNALIIAVADLAYREGSIYHAITGAQVFWGLLTIFMTGILLMGLVRREQHGIAGIGFESFIVLVAYAAAILLLLTAP